MNPLYCSILSLLFCNELNTVAVSYTTIPINFGTNRRSITTISNSNYVEKKKCNIINREAIRYNKNDNQNCQSLNMSPSNNNNEIEQPSSSPPAVSNSNDGEVLQSLFSKFCDSQGLLTKDNLIKIPSIAQLLEDEDLVEDELDEIWESAPKFPIVSDDNIIPPSPTSNDECIDVDSFIQIYRDIDDLFEDDEEEDHVENNEIIINDVIDSNNKDVNTVDNTESNSKALKKGNNELEEEEEETDPIQEKQEHELTLTFETLSKNNDDTSGLISKETLREWDEIESLINDDMFTEDEFNLLWERTTKSPGSADMIDVEGFLSLNVALDDLFEDEGEMEEEDDVDELDDDDDNDITMVTGGSEVPPSVLFAQLANSDNLVGMTELQRWGDLQEMITDGDILSSEYESMYENTPKAVGTNDYLDEAGFTSFYNAIDALFEEDEDDNVGEGKEGDREAEVAEIIAPISVKPNLMELLYDMNQVDELLSSSEEEDDDDEYLLPCGLDCTDDEAAEINSLAIQLEKEGTNKVLMSDVSITPDDLVGSWNLLYASSPMMKFNKGLSGLGGSFPNGKFAGLIQKLQASFFLDVEYTERINVSNPASSSFDVTITGDWELKNSVSLLTGEPSIVLNVEPNKVIYGPTNTRADHWKSVRALNLLNVVYLDDDIRVMRGNMNSDLLFIFQRV